MKIILETNTPQFFNDIAESIRAYYPDAEIKLSDMDSEYDPETYRLVHTLTGEDLLLSRAVLYKGSDMEQEYTYEFLLPLNVSLLLRKRISKRTVKLSVYYLYKNLTGISLPWGSLTGIRPTRIVYERQEQGENSGEIIKNLTEFFDVQPIKSQLLIDIVDNQKEYIDHSFDEADIYVGIPFCVSRCVYCSFASADSLKHKQLIPPYLSALKKEIRWRPVRCGADPEILFWIWRQPPRR